jgi:hypothetical protein
MPVTLQLEEAAIVPLHEAPQLLVEWSPRWEGFVTSIGPAFSRSGSRLAGEAPDTLMPYRGMLKSFSLQFFVLFVLIVLPHQIDRLRPYAAPKVQSYDVIYYSGDELPRTEDLGGAQSGATGRAGGREAHHATQTIRVARGGSLTQKVVDAPNIKLPPSKLDVANFLAMKADPGPPPAEGLHSSLAAPSLPSNVIAPAQVNVTRDRTRGGVTLDAIVPPAPSVSSDKSRTTPTLSADVVPPAPNVQSEHTLYVPHLESSIIAPAPNVSRDRTQAAPSLNPNVIGPATTRVSRDRSRATPALNAGVIPPAPATPGREVARSRVQMNEIGVVPPPVSAPEREAGRNAKLNLPVPSVIAPPPSTDSTHDLRRLESGGSGSASPNVIPPPPTQAANTGLLSSIVGKLFGTQDVVPPPPSVSSGGASGTARSAPRGTSLGSNVVPPPPSVGGSAGGSGAARGSTGRRSQGGLLGTNVIPPPPSVAGSDAGQGSTSDTANSGRSGNGTVLADNIIPPPPSVDGGSSPFGSGTGRKGAGLGGAGDSGSVLAPPKGAGGNSDNSGVVISSQPGSKIGLPGSGGKGSLAMSPAGGDKPGLGGSGGGSSIGHGAGPGSGLAGEGSGAGKTGTGPGSDLNARGGISPTPGPGGAGDATTGTPTVPGVDVRGGSTTTVVTLPSFGSGDGSSPTLPGRSSLKQQQQGPAITIVATSRSGGAFDFYGKLPGDNYTVYVDTSIGTVVMQFAEVNPAAHPGGGAPVGPQGVRTDLPAGLPHARVVIKCQLDASGNLRNLQVLEPGPAAMTAKIMAALPSWKFRPAMRGAQPVEVNAILGFNIDTNDRY